MYDHLIISSAYVRGNPVPSVPALRVQRICIYDLISRSFLLSLRVVCHSVVVLVVLYKSGRAQSGPISNLLSSISLPSHSPFFREHAASSRLEACAATALAAITHALCALKPQHRDMARESACMAASLANTFWPSVSVTPIVLPLRLAVQDAVAMGTPPGCSGIRRGRRAI